MSARLGVGSGKSLERKSGDINYCVAAGGVVGGVAGDMAGVSVDAGGVLAGGVAGVFIDAGGVAGVVDAGGVLAEGVSGAAGGGVAARVSATTS